MGSHASTNGLGSTRDSSNSPELHSAKDSTSPKRKRAHHGSGSSKKVKQALPFQEIVVVQVGQRQKAFSVPKSLLVPTSDFFRAALDGSFRESNTGFVTLPEEDPKTFSHFLIWLYTRKFIDESRSSSGNIEDQDHQSSEAPKPHGITYGKESVNCSCFAIGALTTFDLTKLYLLGDRLLIPTLQNEVIDRLMMMVRCGASKATSALQHVWTYARDDDSIRDFWVTVLAGKMKGMSSVRENMSIPGKELPHDCWVCIVDKVLDPGFSQSKLSKDHCKYHNHGPGDICEGAVRHTGCATPSTL